MKNVFKSVLLVAAVALSSCASDLNTKVSRSTGWHYNDSKMANIAAHAGAWKAPAGMVAIQGGTVTIGEKDEWITAPRDNQKRSISVASFYMDKYEVTNLDWSEYVNWMRVVFGRVAPELVEATLPDRHAFQKELAYNEPYLESYLEHPAFSFYPVVGVTWEQAMAYCQWRTDRVNELALIEAGVMAAPNYADLEPVYKEKKKKKFEATYGYRMDKHMAANPKDRMDSIVEWTPTYEFVRDAFVFNTEKYLLDDKYQPKVGKRPLKNAAGKPRKATRMDNLFVFSYRLPTEAEWEFAAYSPVAGPDGLSVEGKMYPWTGYHSRDLDKKHKKTLGYMQANFVRGRGDAAGVSGATNDGYVFTAPVNAYQPNDFGLYNMSGNVNEWVLDVYRETSNELKDETNGYRGNVYARPLRDLNGAYIYNAVGGIATTFDPEDDVRSFLDGDSTAIIKTDYPLDFARFSEDEIAEYDLKQDPTDILCPGQSNNARIYKGGSWADRIYWLQPSTRRFLEQDKSSATIGFRCAMTIMADEKSIVNAAKKK